MFKKHVETEAERQARSDAFWQRMEQKYPEAIAEADREWRKMVRQTREEIKYLNRKDWIQD